MSLLNRLSRQPSYYHMQFFNFFQQKTRFVGGFLPFCWGFLHFCFYGS